VAQIMRHMDIFVLPSLAEGISNTILEAMASALPVIATRVGGNEELVIEDETGVLVPPDDPESISQSLMTYIEEGGPIKQHGCNAKSTAEKKYSIESMVKGYLQIYDRRF
jgi:glycosyltransferase involved in cell wall biosynthesis